jgi:hypothetical protein
MAANRPNKSIQLTVKSDVSLRYTLLLTAADARRYILEINGVRLDWFNRLKAIAAARAFISFVWSTPKSISLTKRLKKQPPSETKSYEPKKRALNRNNQLFFGFVLCNCSSTLSPESFYRLHLCNRATLYPHCRSSKPSFNND